MRQHAKTADLPRLSIRRSLTRRRATTRARLAADLREARGFHWKWRKQMSATPGKPFVIDRVFDAPRDKLWKAWTEAERLKKWWGPAGFIVHTCKVDLRPGGVFLYGMKAPDGSDMWGKFTYREITAPKKLVFIVSF